MSLGLVSTPACVSKRVPASRGDVIDEGKIWLHEYLVENVQQVQEMKQHHVHTLNGEGECVPLTHCNRLDNPKLCKAGFPRKDRLIDKPVILCPGLLHHMNMPSRGAAT